MKKFINNLSDIFNHKPTQSEVDYAKFFSLLSDAQSWSNRDAEAEKALLEILVSNINQKIIKDNE